MIKIIKNKIFKVVYEGVYDSKKNMPEFKFETENKEMSFKLSDIIKQSNILMNKFCVPDLKEISHKVDITITLYPNGNFGLSLIEESINGLETCYLIEDVRKEVYAIIAFEEVNKFIYKCEILCVFTHI
jgi:hypothetical protein